MQKTTKVECIINRSELHQIVREHFKELYNDVAWMHATVDFDDLNEIIVTLTKPIN